MEFEPCPYCGFKPANPRVHINNIIATSQLECLNCGSVGPKADSVYSAMIAWNKRTDGRKGGLSENV